MSLGPRALAALRAVAATLVGGNEGTAAALAARVAGHVATLPRAADRAEFALLLTLFESRVINLLVAGIPRPISAMTSAHASVTCAAGPRAGCRPGARPFRR